MPPHESQLALNSFIRMSLKLWCSQFRKSPQRQLTISSEGCRMLLQTVSELRVLTCFSNAFFKREFELAVSFPNSN